MSSRHTPVLNRLRRRLRGLSQAALVESLQEQLETMDVAAIAADNSGRYVAANGSACELTGYSRSEIVLLTVRELTRATYPHTADDRWSRFIQSGSESGEYLVRRKDGVPVVVRYLAYASIAPGIHLLLLTEVKSGATV